MTPLQWKRLLSRTIFYLMFLGALCAVSIVGLATWNVFQKEREARKNLSDERMALGELEFRRDTLTAQLARLETDRGLEEEIRKRFPLVRDGEEVIVLIEGNDAPVPLEKTGTSNGLWGWFGGWFER